MTRAAEQCREYLEAKHPGIRIGRQACRNTADGFISQHSAYTGRQYDSNALDIMGGSTDGINWGRAKNIKLIQEVVDDLSEKLEEWSIRKILWQVRLHFGHAHIDFYPMCDTKQWCKGDVALAVWVYSDDRHIRSDDPDPENGAYNGDDMKWKDIVDDATWAKAYEDGFITGNPLWMPQYYQENGVGEKAGAATEDEKKNGYNVIMQAQMEKTK
jgi:hypothetical protein